MTTPTLYASSDASAPVLTGTAGDLVNLLRKCLVDGYGSKAAAGWTKPYDDGAGYPLRAVFRQGAGKQFYLDVDDRGAAGILTGASGQEAAVRGYEAMTAVATGTNPFPTTAQVAAATANWRKSAAADAVARAWFLIADDRTLILGVLDGDSAGVYKTYYFGDVYSLKTGDSYNAAITARTAVNSTGIGGTIANAFSASDTAGLAGHYVARPATAAAGAVGLAVLAIGTALPTATTFTSALDSGLYLARLLLVDQASTRVLRGWMRGVYAIANPSGLNDGDTFSGVGDFAGRTFVVVRSPTSGSTVSAIAIETTAWDTSS